MKQWMIPLFIIISVVLTACSSGDKTGEDPENNTSEDAVSKPSEETAESEEQDLETEESAEEEEAHQRHSEDTADNEESKENYTAAEHCIMTQLAECENVPPEDQFKAYRDLVADSTLPGATVCLVPSNIPLKQNTENLTR